MQTKHILVIAVALIATIIPSSNGANCDCQCCVKELDNPDCALESAGILNVSSCATSECSTACLQSFPAQCNQNQSVFEPKCSAEVTTTAGPVQTTTRYGGLVECRCACCFTSGCQPSYIGNVIADTCDACPEKCINQYPTQCMDAILTNECGPAPTSAGSTTPTSAGSTTPTPAGPTTPTSAGSTTPTSAGSTKLTSAGHTTPHSGAGVIRDSQWICLLAMSMVTIAKMFM